jgi:hypothetical protein
MKGIHVIAEVVGSNHPTRSISFCVGTTVLIRACFRQLSDKSRSNAFSEFNSDKFDEMFDIRKS